MLQDGLVSTLAHQKLREVYTVVLREFSPIHSPCGLRTSIPSRLHSWNASHWGNGRQKVHSMDMGGG